MYGFLQRVVLLIGILGWLASPDLAQDEETISPEPPEIVPMMFPVLGPLSERLIDTYGAPRSGGRSHAGQDLMARKMTPLIAVFAGTVRFTRTSAVNASNLLYLDGDNGYTAIYIHINNDTPGTDDGLGSQHYAFAPNLRSGSKVIAGQFLGWVGDSGNAEETGPHLHFELSQGYRTFNAYPSLKNAQRLEKARYAPPKTERKPEPGQARLDAVVETVDGKRQVIAVRPVWWQRENGKSSVVTKPGVKWVRWKNKLKNDKEAKTTQLPRVGPGDLITLFVSVETVSDDESTESDGTAEKPALVASYLVVQAVAPPPGVARNSPKSQPRPRPGTPTLPKTLPPVVVTEPDLPPSKPEIQSPPVPAVLLAPSPDLVERTLASINFYRRQRDLPDLTADVRLHHAAQSHADYLTEVNQFSHRGRNNSRAIERVREAGYEAVSVQELLAAHVNTPEKAVEIWKVGTGNTSPLFLTSVTQLGLGFVERAATQPGPRRIWVLLLGSPKTPAQSAPTP